MSRLSSPRLSSLVSSLLMLIALLSSTAALARSAELTVLFTGDNTGEIEPCG